MKNILVIGFYLLSLLFSNVYAYSEDIGDGVDANSCSSTCPTGATPNCTCAVAPGSQVRTTTKAVVYGGKPPQPDAKKDNADQESGNQWCFNKVEKTDVEKGICGNDKIRHLDYLMNKKVNGKKAPIELIQSRVEVRDEIDMTKKQASSELYTWYVTVNDCLDKGQTDCFPQRKQPTSGKATKIPNIIDFTLNSTDGVSASGQISNKCENGGGFESLNSGKPLDDAEIKLCNMKSLVELDKELNYAYSTASPSKKKDQKEWIEERNKQLMEGATAKEMQKFYRARIQYLTR